MSEDIAGNLMVSVGELLHVLPKNAQAQHQEFVWPFDTVERIAFGAGCGDGWLFTTTEGWVWVDVTDLGLFQSGKKRKRQDQSNAVR